MGFFALACKNPVTELPRTRWFSLLSAPVVPYTARRRPLIPSWTSFGQFDRDGRARADTE
jgi:hypothetical protein